MIKVNGKVTGIKEVEEKGRDEEREKSRLKDVDRVLKLLSKKFINIDETLKRSLKDLNDEKFNFIIDNILEIKTLQDVQKYLVS